MCRNQDVEGFKREKMGKERSLSVMASVRESKPAYLILAHPDFVHLAAEVVHHTSISRMSNICAWVLLGIGPPKPEVEELFQRH